jgi:hypothetical protein
MSKSWGEDQAEQIAAEVKRLRGNRSGQWLSDRTGELGHRVSRTTLSEMESGRRRYFTTAELCVLAAALNSVPAALMYPDPCAELEMLPDYKTTGPFAVQWFSGLLDGPPKVIEKTKTPSGRAWKVSPGDDPAAFDRNLSRLRIAREVWELEERRFALASQDAGGTDKERSTYFDAIADIQRRIDALMERYGR